MVRSVLKECVLQPHARISIGLPTEKEALERRVREREGVIVAGLTHIFKQSLSPEKHPRPATKSNSEAEGVLGEPTSGFDMYIVS